MRPSRGLVVLLPPATTPHTIASLLLYGVKGGRNCKHEVGTVGAVDLLLWSDGFYNHSTKLVPGGTMPKASITFPTCLHATIKIFSQLIRHSCLGFKSMN